MLMLVALMLQILLGIRMKAVIGSEARGVPGMIDVRLCMRLRLVLLDNVTRLLLLRKLLMMR
jgi:hypothetical protein